MLNKRETDAAAPAHAGDSIASLKYPAKRKNIPPAGLEAQGVVQQAPKLRYEYNPHLPPMLRSATDAAAADKLPELLAIARQRALSADEAQVLADALRRMDYTPDPKTGLLTAEYVDIFGIPFSLIPFKGREPGSSVPPDDQPKHEVLALPERKAFEIRFPVVEGYVVALKRNRVTADVGNIERTALDAWRVPVAAFVRPQVGYQVGHPSAHGGFGFELVDRQAYYDSIHPQTIELYRARSQNT